MLRYLAGVASALLLVTGGLLIWTSRAEQEKPIPPAPAFAAVGDEEPPRELPKATPKSREERRFGRYDKDKDGTITRAEMMETRRKPFQRLDKNGDGRLSFDEWAVATADRFGGADKDRSGTLTPAEFATTRRAEPAAQPRCNC